MKYQLPLLSTLLIAFLSLSSSFAQDCEGLFDDLYFELVPILDGTDLTVEVRSLNFNLATFQYTLVWDSTKLDLISLSDESSGLLGSVFSNQINQQLGIIWVNQNAQNQDLPDGSLLFTLQFVTSASYEDCLPIAMSNSIIDKEIAFFSTTGAACFTRDPNNFFFNDPLCNYVNLDDQDFDGFPPSEDCDDLDFYVNPSVIDLCNGIDSNCNGLVDDDAWTLQYIDLDGDGFGDPNVDSLLCAGTSGWVLNDDDCDDNNVDINPDALECQDGLDNDCDGEIDEFGFEHIFYPDEDGDGYGAINEGVETCFPIEGYTNMTGDCDDTNALIFPFAEEVCDGVDNNCNGQVDEGLANIVNESPAMCFGDLTYFEIDVPSGFDPFLFPEIKDESGNLIATALTPDGILFPLTFLGPGLGYSPGVTPGTYFITVYTEEECEIQLEYTTPAGPPEIIIDILEQTSPDCDGNPGNISVAVAGGVGALALEWNDGSTDTSLEVTEGGSYQLLVTDENFCTATALIELGESGTLVPTTFYLDADQDGYGDESNSLVDCVIPDGYVLLTSDCNDNDPNINPAAEEIPGNGIDEDCDGLDGSTSVSDTDANYIKLYPNPIQDILFINFQDKIVTNANIKIFNQQGKELMSQELIHSKTTINIEQFDSGLYFYFISNENESVATGKLVKI